MPGPYAYEYPHPAVTVDVAIFTVLDDSLRILLIQRRNPPHQGMWALPGGFVDIDESLKHAAWRELKEETGINAAYLEQFYTFGHQRRDPRERVITVAYLALLPPDKLTLQAGSDAERAEWFDVQRLPELAFDHPKIIARALHRLNEKIGESSVVFELLPETFTLPELRRVIELIRGEPLDRRNFRKRMLKQGLIEPTGEVARRGAHRPAKLYRTAVANQASVSPNMHP